MHGPLNVKFIFTVAPFVSQTMAQMDVWFLSTIYTYFYLFKCFAFENWL